MSDVSIQQFSRKHGNLFFQAIRTKTKLFQQVKGLNKTGTAFERNKS